MDEKILVEDPRNALLHEAYEWAYQRANEEGDVDPERDYVIMEAWAAEQYLYLCKLEGIEP